MLKRLLTLLAILTGLTALGAPAHARTASVDNVQVAASGEGHVQCAATQIVPHVLPVERLGRGRDALCQSAAVTVMVPTVRIHVDRSRE